MVHPNPPNSMNFSQTWQWLVIKLLPPSSSQLCWWIASNQATELSGIHPLSRLQDRFPASAESIPTSGEFSLPFPENSVDASRLDILLIDDEHILGRVAADSQLQIDSNSVSAKRCRVYRKRTSTEDACCPSFFLKDTSTNGTYLNLERLKKNSQEAKICHSKIYTNLFNSKGYRS